MRLLTLLICLALALPLAAQKKVKYKKTPSGLRYCVLYDAPGKTPAVGDALFFRSWIYKMEKGKPDSLLYYNEDGGVLINADFKKGSIDEGVRALSAGDSAMYLINIDTFCNQNGMDVPPFLKKGQDLRFVFKITRLATKEEVAQERDERAKRMIAQRLEQAKQYKAQMLVDPTIQAQLQHDDVVLKEHLRMNNVVAERSPNGVYYKITEKGTGKANMPGDSIKVYYTGKLLDGSVFDSNMTAGSPPFVFVLGTLEVIMGWDEMMVLLHKGDKATFYIPSALAYGEQGAGAQILPNSCLIFEVEIVE